MAEENVSRSCGSDVVFDFFCELCFDDNKQVEAEGFCVDCGEYLCGSCYHGHRKSRLTRHHVLQDHENMPKDTPLSVNRVIKDITTKCKLHRSAIVKYYCRDHNVLVCSTCFFEAHRGCSGVESILDVSVNLLENQELINFLDQLKSLQKKTRDTLAHARENKTVSERCYAGVVSSVRRLKEETIEKLNEAEQNIIALAVQMKKEDEGKMKSVEMDCEAMSGKLEQMSTDVESLHISKRVCQLYISMRELNGEVMELQKSIGTLRENIVVRTFRFEPNPDFPSVLRNPEVLGKISIQHEQPLMTMAIAVEAPRTTTGSHGADTKLLPCPEYQHASVSQGAESSSVVDPSKRGYLPMGIMNPSDFMGLWNPSYQFGRGMPSQGPPYPPQGPPGLSQGPPDQRGYPPVSQMYPFASMGPRGYPPSSLSMDIAVKAPSEPQEFPDQIAPSVDFPVMLRVSEDHFTLQNLRILQKKLQSRIYSLQQYLQEDMGFAFFKVKKVWLNDEEHAVYFTCEVSSLKEIDDFRKQFKMGKLSRALQNFVRQNQLYKGITPEDGFKVYIILTDDTYTRVKYILISGDKIN